ncbi:BTAD domain-containing putative transcriptional regulator [Actinoplanes sp. NPDC026619]|uniref:AfsR/SARP family transcriptional regulator n=1 Tax=Actinoplanes sp. NPDC026619 TaxID=3155798 RepID=UPI0033F1BA2D
MMQVSVLGPVEVRDGAGTVAGGGDRQQAVLGVLVAAGGRVVSADRLADQVWNGAPPAKAASVLQVYVSRLRRLLEPDRPPRSPATALVSDAGGYALRLPDEAVDAWSFEREVRLAAELPPLQAVELLRTALGRWRGRPYEQFTDEAWARTEIARLREARSVAHERETTALLRLGRTADAVLAARALADAEPLRGEAWRLLALGLWASHRSADALDVLRAHHARLDEELGLHPEPALAALERAILEQRTEVLAEAIGPAATAVRPAQLPRAGAAFAGRADELAELERMLDESGEAPLAVIAGVGGVGKTTLALRWAHRHADRYADGHLYADLRGFGPEEAPANPSDVLFAFLAALGLPEHRVPPGLDERVALFRSVLAGRRMLLLLDNARDAAQVRPLLPGARGCAVVVTGRSGLAGLVVAEGAQLLRLDAFGADDAREYLRTRLGAAVVDAEPAAGDAVVARCGGLPLALAVVGARAARHPLAAVAEELAGEQGLDAFAMPGDESDPRSVFSWSYRHLSADEAELFRRLALHPGPYVTLDAATAVAGGDRRDTHRLLRQLSDAHLIIESRPGRFVYHDLLRAYAMELPGDQRETIDRLAWHHLYAAANAAKILYPFRPSRVAEPPPEMSAPVFTEREPALSWLDIEYDNVMALTSARPDLLGRFVWSLGQFQQDVRYHLDETIELTTRALAEAERDGDQWWIGYLHYMVGRAWLRLDRGAEAQPHLRRAIEVGRTTDDPGRLAHGLLAYAMSITPVNTVPTAEQAEAAFPYATEARAVYRRLPASVANVEEANTLGVIGWHHWYRPGGHEDALGLMREAVEVHTRWSNPYGEASARMELGRMLLLADEVDQAIAEFRQALEIYGERRALWIEPLVGLYQCHLRAGDSAAAVRVRDEALGLLEIAHYPDLDRITRILGSSAEPIPAASVERVNPPT